MELKIYESDRKILIRFHGRIVLDECDRLKSTIVPMISPQVTNLFLDLSGVEFIDSAGLGALVGIKVSSNKHRTRLALLNPSRGVSDILMVSKLDSIFDIITGHDAEGHVRSLAQPQYERSADGPAAGPMVSRGPAIPAMPGAGLPSSPAAALSPKDRIDKLLRDAVEHMRKGDYEQAAQCYIDAIEVNPDYLPAHNNLAIVYEKQPQTHAKAIEQWTKVLNLSRSRGDQKHIERAVKHLNQLQSQGGV